MFLKQEIDHFHHYVDPWKREQREKFIYALKVLYPEFSELLLELDEDLCIGLLHHTFYMCVESSENQNHDLAYQAIRLWSLKPDNFQQSIVSNRGKSWLFLQKECCINQKSVDSKFETGCYFVGEGAVLTGHKLDKKYLNETWELLENTHLYFFVELASNIIVNLQYRDLDESMTGYTLRPLQGTVFTDWTDAPLRYAESILHESAHSWLNCYLSAFGKRKLNSANLYWSPWRGMDRPALGLLHGVWAFSIVFHFYNRLASNQGYGLLTEQQIKYCHGRSQFEFMRLQEAAHSIREVLRDMNEEVLQDMVLSYYPS